MSAMLTIAFPAAEAMAGSFATAGRPLLGLSALLAFVMVFKPLLTGLLRAAWLVVQPWRSVEDRIVQRKIRAAAKLRQLAREVESSQPNLAHELHHFASRD